MIAHSLMTSAESGASRVAPDSPSRRSQIRVCTDQPDWSAYAWSNPGLVVYGPVSSRRLGRSLGINLFPNGKLCSFHCAYCHLDTAPENHARPTLLPESELLPRMVEELSRFASEASQTPDSLTFAGNGEPTLHPAFGAAVELAAQLCAEYLPGTPMSLFTDGMHLSRASVSRAAERFGRVFLKLDGATEEVVDRIGGSGAWRGTCRAVQVAAPMTNVAASTAVLGGPSANVADVMSARFVDLASQLAPRELYLYTIDYPNPSPSVSAVEWSTLLECAEWLAARLSFPVIGLWREHPHPMSSGVSLRE